MTSDPANVPLYIVFAAILLILNGIVILAKTALDSVSRNKIKEIAKEDDDKRVERLVKLLEKPSRYGYTNRLMSYAFLLAGTFMVLQLPYNKLLLLLIYYVLVVCLSYFLPRKIAMQHSEGLSFVFCGVQNAICVVLFPLRWTMILISNIFLKLLRQETDVDDREYSEDEVMSMLEVGQEKGVLKEEGKKMINSIFAFDDELAYEIMTPRTDVFFIDIDDSPEEYLDKLMELRYSRIPVCQEDTDNIIGILHIKDYLIKAREDGFDRVDIASILRKAYFVPETKNIDALFFELQKEKQHIAILIDEYGGFSGIVTMEDIIEEVMGDIDDEYDEEEMNIEKIDGNTYYVNGNMSLDDLDEALNLTLESENSETIGGFLIDILGEIPDEGQFAKTVSYENLVFSIISVKERRIEKIKLYIGPEPEKDTKKE